MDPSAGRTCRWLICRSVVNANLMNECAKAIQESAIQYNDMRVDAVHIAHATRRCLHCCGDGANPTECDCKEVTSPASFKKCQYKNDCAAHLWCSRDCNRYWPNDFPAAKYNGPHHWSRCP